MIIKLMTNKISIFLGKMYTGQTCFANILLIIKVALDLLLIIN